MSEGNGGASHSNGSASIRAGLHRALTRDQLGVLVIGCGYWGRHYVRVFRDLPETGVAAACDSSVERLGAIDAEFEGLKLVQDLEVALALPGIDCAIVATQAATHFAIAARCLEAGLPVLVEKPLTTSSADAAELVELANKRGLTLMVGHTFVYNAAVQKVKEYLDSGALGGVYYMYARRTSLGPIRTDVNALWDLASHDVSIFNYLLGDEPEWVSAIGARVLRTNREDVGFVSVGYPGGIVAHIHVSWADPNKRREIVVVGSDRQVVFDDLNTLERVRVFSKGVTVVTPGSPNYGEFLFQLRDGDIVSPLIDASEPLKNECAHFVECLRSRRSPITDGRAGGLAVRVIEAIDRSIAGRGEPVSVSKEGSKDEHSDDLRAYAAR
jgi:predicted dehydrogenase